MKSQLLDMVLVNFRQKIVCYDWVNSDFRSKAMWGREHFENSVILIS